MGAFHEISRRSAIAPDTFKPPRGVTTVDVCQLSGQLPGAACDRVIAEYFVRGAAPTQMCQEHYLYASSTQIATVLSSGSAVASIGPRTVMAGTAGSEAPPELVVAPAESAATKEQPQKKRGFWGRLFGRDRADKTEVESQKNGQVGLDLSSSVEATSSNSIA